MAYLATALAVGIVMAEVVELPMLRLRDRWFASSRRAVEITFAPPAVQPASPLPLATVFEAR